MGFTGSWWICGWVDAGKATAGFGDIGGGRERCGGDLVESATVPAELAEQGRRGVEVQRRRWRDGDGQIASPAKVEANHGELSLFQDFLLLLPIASFLVFSLIFCNFSFWFIFFLHLSILSSSFFILHQSKTERELVRSTPTLGKGGHRGRGGWRRQSWRRELARQSWALRR